MTAKMNRVISPHLSNDFRVSRCSRHITSPRRAGAPYALAQAGLQHQGAQTNGAEQPPAQGPRASILVNSLVSLRCFGQASSLQSLLYLPTYLTVCTAA